MSTLTHALENGPAIPVTNCISDTETVFEPHPNSGRVFTPNYRTLVSIFPDELTTHMLHAGGRKEYKFPAVPKGSYALLRVYDTWVITRDLGRAGAAGDNEPDDGYAMQKAPVYCHAIADDLVRQWAGDAPGNASGAKPGIGIIQGDVPTQLELDQLNEIQTTYFRWLVSRADDYWITGMRTYITDDHRRALRWLGSQDRDWYKKIQAVLLKRCYRCVEEVNAMATACKHCNANFIKYYEELGVEPTYEEDPGVYQFFLKRAAKIEADRPAREAAARRLAQEQSDREAKQLVAAAEERAERIAEQVEREKQGKVTPPIKPQAR